MKINTALFAFLAAAFACITQAAPPTGWWMAPSDEYMAGVDVGDLAQPAAYIEAIVPVPKQFIALNQTFSAKDYLGKRVRLKGMIRTQDVSKWAGFWLRADKEDNKIVAFDNMQRRGITGTTDWVPAEIVLDIPQEAERLFLGLILDGSGKVWMRGLSFEVVDGSVPVTAPRMRDLPKAPTNLDFKEK